MNIAGVLFGVLIALGADGAGGGGDTAKQRVAAREQHAAQRAEVTSHLAHPVSPKRARPAPHPRRQVPPQPPRSPLLRDDFFAPVDNLLTQLRKEWLEPISLTFNPSAGITYQHATKVRDGYPHGRSFIWYGWSGDWTFWSDDDGLGQIVYSAAGNSGLGTSTFPFMGEAVGDPDYMNNILVANRIALYMLYWQQEMCDHKVRVRVGKFEDQVFFDNNTIAYDPVSGFLAENFNEQIVMPFPSYAFGVNVEWDVTDELTLRGGTLNSENPGNHAGFDGMSWSHLFTTAEADLTVKLPINGEDRVGHWRFTGWFNSMENPFGEGDVDGIGICFNMDQKICDEASVFMRLGWGENQATRSNFAVSTGFAVDHPFGLEGHHTGLAFEYAKLTPYGRSQVGLPAIPGEQYMAEWYWRVELTNTIDIGPVVQMVRDVTAGIDTSIIWGIRSSWSF